LGSTVLSARLAADSRSKLIQAVAAPLANVPDSAVPPDLLHRQETRG